MALHDYQCSHCGALKIDQYRSIEEGAQANPPRCGACDVLMTWIPQVGSMDAFEPGAEFTVYDGQNRPILIESFAKMKQLERDSEQQFRNGEGHPLRFRRLHQDTNREKNLFGEIPQEKPTDAGKQKFGLGRGAQAIDGSDGAPEVAFGDGVHEGNTSALKGGL